MSDIDLDNEDLRAALVAAARGGEPLTAAMKEIVEGWLAETWGERVNGDDHRFVTPSQVAMELAWDEEKDPHDLLALPDEEFLAVIRAGVDRVSVNDNEMNLSAATVVEIADGAGGSVWVVDMWGGGYIASEPPQEFLGPYGTEAEATAALHSLGFFDGSDVQIGDLPDFRQELDAQVQWRFDG